MSQDDEASFKAAEDLCVTELVEYNAVSCLIYIPLLHCTVVVVIFSGNWDLDIIMYAGFSHEYDGSIFLYNRQ